MFKPNFDPFFGRGSIFSDFLICSKTKCRIIFKFEIQNLWLITQHVKLFFFSKIDFQYQGPRSFLGRIQIFGPFYLKSYHDDIWYVGTLSDLEYECLNRISIFGPWPFFGREPRFSDCSVCSKTMSRIIFKFEIYDL